ncbi:MAG: radical SAM protein [Candidatus Muirbacterium halophilum]|nr:radical SAM protein [Candidatus Muirbacterium halophilum]MCK9475729.1 radical SAM protein [Candidatus Muirbacterium halophilum]
MGLGNKKEYLSFDIFKKKRFWNLMKFLFIPGKGKLNYFPLRYNIDPSSVCNLKCPYCIHCKDNDNTKIKKSIMSMEDFLIIFNKIKDYALLIEFYNFGEPLLNKNLPEMIKMCSDFGIKTRISSNMSVDVGEDFLSRLIDSGINRITCAVDGHNDEINKKYRVGSNFDIITKNINTLVKLKKSKNAKKTVISWRTLLFEWNYAYKEDIKKTAMEFGVDEINFDPGSFMLNDRKVSWDISNKKWKDSKKKFSKDIINKQSGKKCSFLFNSTIVNANGNLITCCLSGEKEAENKESLVLNSLYDVWNSKEFINTRLYNLGISDDRQNILELCKKCRLL